MAETDGSAGQEAVDDDGRGEDTLIAAGDERLLAPTRARPRWPSRARFIGLLLLVLVIHAALIATFLVKDRDATFAVAQLEETPVEIVVEAPKPEPPKPPELQPKPPEQKPEPPRPKEDLSPALSAPRAPNEDHVKTDAKEAKSTAPTKLEKPTLGQPEAAPAAAPPKPETPTPPSKEEAKQQDEDKTKPDAEALNKAAPKASKSKQTRAKEAKPSPRHKSLSNAFASLGGAPDFGAMSFARPAPKTKIYGGTEDVRWMSEVEAMLEAKVQQLPRSAHWQAGGRVLICFHVDVSGRVTVKEWCQKSGYPDVDQLAMRALTAAAPFPPPPPGVEHGLVWSTQFDGQLPVLHISKR